MAFEAGHFSGQDLGLHLRVDVLVDLQVLRGFAVAMKAGIDGKRLVIERADAMPEFTQRQLARALQKTRKRMIDFGPPRGREIL